MLNLYETLVVGNEKAIVGLVLGAVGSFLVAHGLSLDMTLKEAVQSLVAGLVTGGSVYLKKNSV